MKGVCEFCRHAPCLLQKGLLVSLAEKEAEIRDDSLEGLLGNKCIRILLRNHARRWIVPGYSCTSDAPPFPLPRCVLTEILHLAPPCSTPAGECPESHQQLTTPA